MSVDIRIIDSHLNTEYLKKYGVGTDFIETGTYRGDTVYIAQESGYKNIFSCELFVPLYERAVKLFEHDKNIVIYNMDSPDFIKHVLENELNERPATFWLDAHASGPLPGGKSGGSPILDELRAIYKYGKRNDHTILIDDKRLFGSAEWNGVQLQDAMSLLMEINPNYQYQLLDGVEEKDIICHYIPRGV